MNLLYVMAQLAHQFDLVRLNAFLAVAEEGSITAAAERLGVAQPALSASIKRLEADLGHRLFDRLPRGVALTPAGRQFLPEVYEVFGILGGVQARLDAYTEVPRGEVSIGLPPSAGAVLIQPLLRRLTQAFPHVSIRMVEAMSGYLQGWVASGDLDIGLTFSAADTETVTATPIFEEEVMLIGRRADIETLPTPFPIHRLSEIPLIVTSSRHRLRHDIDTQMEALGKELNILYEIDAGNQLVQLVSAGTGYGIFARSAFSAELAEGIVAAIPFAPNYRRVGCLVVHRRKALDRIVRMVLEEIRATSVEFAPRGHWTVLR